jgi:ribosomal protein L15
MPFLRGKMRNKSLFAKPIALQITALSVLPKNAVVDIPTLVKYKLVSEKEATARGVKLLGGEAISVPLTVKIALSASARKSIEKAQGTVEA